MEKSSISEFRIIEESIKSEMSNVLLDHPFYDIRVPLIFAAHVTDENGTGAVHIAPGHGTEDYLAGLQHGLEVFNPVDDHGRFKESLPIFGGMKVRESNQEIVSLLKKKMCFFFRGL